MSRRFCYRTNCLIAPSPVRLRKALRRWCAASSFLWKMSWPKHQLGPLLAIAGVQDPGNLGTILRSAEAFGAGGVLLGEGTAGAFNSKVIRASAGSVFRLPIAKTKLTEALPQMRAQGLRLVATSSHKSKPLGDADLSGSLAIFIGSEGAGLPRELLARMDEVVAIPHSPNVESLNAGVAASIVLYEVAKQKNDLPRRH